jgi:hypothetical protein
MFFLSGLPPVILDVPAATLEQCERGKVIALAAVKPGIVAGVLCAHMGPDGPQT